jgi:hypothetical protein
MVIRAERDPRFYLRFVIIGWAAIAFALWSLYDGAIKYPRQRERGLLFEQLMEEGRGDQWDEEATKRGWPIDFPGEPKTEADITMQYAMAALAGTIGGLVLLGVWRSRGRWIEGGDTGITSSWGQSFSYDQVLTLDKRSWRNKGIARVKYADGHRKRRFVIDDYKFKRKETDDILYELEGRIGPDKIIGGPPEPLRETAKRSVDGEVVADESPVVT